jgi:hypothetical protein
MPKRTRATDRRGHGVGDNVGTAIDAKANLQDQRKAGAYGPPASGPSTSSEFATGVAAGRPQGAGASLGQAKSRTMAAPRKLGAS